MVFIDVPFSPRDVEGERRELLKRAHEPRESPQNLRTVRHILGHSVW